MSSLYKGNTKINKIYVKTRVNTDYITATAADIVSGKTSIDADYNTITGTMNIDISMPNLTSDATAIASDITLGKTLYANGVKITGTARRPSLSTLIGGSVKKHIVASGQVINEGDFVKVIVIDGNVRVTKSIDSDDIITGIANNSGIGGNEIEVVYPNL